jgi:MATE family multidrug resistance protein
VSPAVRASVPRRADFRELLELASPIVLVQVGLMLMGTVDILMVGHVSPVALAAVALGNLYFIGWSIFGLGTLFALDPILSQALGARDGIAVQRGIQRGIVLAFVLTVPTTLVLLTVEPVLTLVGQPEEVIPYAAGYIYRTVLSVFPFFVFVVLRQSLQAQRHTRPIVITIIVANILNAVLNYAWIFGELGFPALGVFGSAWATLTSRWLMTLMLLSMGWPYLRPHLTGLAPRVFAAVPLLRILAIGVPIGGQMMLEWGAFATIALLMGWLGITEVAAHQIALNLASLTFMVPVGISSAAAVLVGHAVGRGDPAAVRRAAAAALVIGIGFMSLTAVALIGFPRVFAELYTDSADVLGIALLLLPIAGVFQVFDGAQVVALGALRGLGDTRMPMIAAIVGFWCLGIPASLWLGFRIELGAEGLWWGFVVGLSAVAVFLLLRLRAHVWREHVRLAID